MTLIERLEALTAPDREVDAEIAKVMDTTVVRHHRESGTNITTTNCHYTSSLDAALTLVPEGWEWLREHLETMCVYLPKHNDVNSWDIHITGAHKTPAIALCIAALKARGVK